MKSVKTSRSTIWLFAALLMFLYACDSSKVYQEFEDFDESYWGQDNRISFEFFIEDESQNYNLLALFRNSLSYPYNNMYYRYQLTDPEGTVMSEDLKQIFLFDAKTGEPYGSGVGDLFDQKQPILENYKFDSPGTYKIELEQAMRLDTLPFILSVGWRVETAE